MIEIKDLVKVYGKDQSKTVALDGVNLKIEDGEMVAIMGPSGSGKSTLLNIIGGMDGLTSGTYICDGVEVGKLKSSKLHIFRRDHISFVFQNFSLLNHYTAYENVEVPLNAKKIKKSKRKEIIHDKLKKLGIDDLAKKTPLKMSGGQQQRVAIARALASDNNIILADEPTGALDSKNGEEIMNIFDDIQKTNKTIIIVTHDEKIAKRCKRIIRIEDGKITSDEKLQKI